jgi:hypothetical protein
MPQDVFFIFNTTRSIHTGSVRRALLGPESSTKNLFLAGGLVRVVRGRPSPVTGDFLRKHIHEVQDKERKGLVRVYNARSQRVDLTTLAAVTEDALREDATLEDVVPPEVPEVPTEEGLTSTQEVAVDTAELSVEEIFEEGTTETTPVASEEVHTSAGSRRRRRG